MITLIILILIIIGYYITQTILHNRERKIEKEAQDTIKRLVVKKEKEIKRQIIDTVYVDEESNMSGTFYTNDFKDNNGGKK